MIVREDCVDPLMIRFFAKRDPRRVPCGTSLPAEMLAFLRFLGVGVIGLCGVSVRMSPFNLVLRVCR
jgi:hypothetical protein